MVFLSYPKYYRDTEEKLALVETALVESTDPEWDYKVNKGIWQLKVKTDGTFQAQHEGDVFTYRFQNLGIGQGSDFRSVDLGEPDFSNFQIIGDTIRWSEVLPDIDLTVRYIHDILKVDVIVKQEFMNDLRAEVNSGGLSGDDYLTARFDIPSVFINSQAKQGDEDRDIYAEPIEFTNAPLTFERDGKVLHKLRPVESYVLDEDGEPMYWDESNEPINIRSSQRWQLQRDGGGFAEMSANLGDLANAPEGDVVLDPSTTFGESDLKDALLSNESATNYGSTSLLSWYGDDHYLFAADVSILPDNVIIQKAEIHIYEYQDQTEDGVTIVPYKVTNNNWEESQVDWFEYEDSKNWLTQGGDFATNEFVGSLFTDDFNDNGYLTINVTQPFKRYLYDNQKSDVFNKGFLLKRIDGDNNKIRVRTKETIITNEKPKFKVWYSFTNFGADPGNGFNISEGSTNGDVSDRIDNLEEDNLNEMLVFVGDYGLNSEGSGQNLSRIASEAVNSKVVPVFVAKAFLAASEDEIEYASYVENVLLENLTHIQNGTIEVVELGNEPADGSWHNPEISYFWTGSSNGAQRFTPYYLEAYDKIKWV